MNNQNDILKNLAYLVDGYIAFRESILEKRSDMPANFIKGISYMKVLALKEGKSFPSNMNDFSKLINIPIGDWGYDFLNDAIADLGIENFCLYQPELVEEFDEYSYYNEEDYDEDVDVLAQAKEIRKALFSGTDIEEFYNDKIFYELFKHLDQEEYQICRDGINNSLLNTRNFLSSGNFKGVSPDVKHILENDVYTKVDKFTQVHKHPDYPNGVVFQCPECGALLERYERHHLKCPIPKCEFKKKLLKQSLFAFDKNKPIPYKDNLLVLKKSFHNSIKFPGIAEMELLEALNAFNKKYGLISNIEKYPKKDSADFLIYFTNGDIHIIDVKDYKNPEDLAKHLNEKASNDITKKKHGIKYTKAFIIAPNYLNHVYKYKEKFESEMGATKLNFHFVDSYIKELELLGKDQQLSLL